MGISKETKKAIAEWWNGIIRSWYEFGDDATFGFYPRGYASKCTVADATTLCLFGKVSGDEGVYVTVGAMDLSDELFNLGVMIGIDVRIGEDEAGNLYLTFLKLTPEEFVAKIQDLKEG